MPAAVRSSGRGLVLGTSVGFVALLAATWVVSGLAVEVAGADVVAAGRSTFSCLGLCLLAGRSRGALRRAAGELRRRPLTLAVAGVLGVAVYASASLQAIALVGISLPNLLLATTPCVSLLIGVLVRRDRAPRLAVVGVVVATAGAAAYVLGTFRVGGGGPAVALGTLAAGFAVLAIAVYGQYYARLSAGRDPLDLLPGIFLAGTAVLLVLLGVTGRLGALAGVSAYGWLLLATLGLVIYVPVYVLQHRLIHLRGAVYMASLSLVVPFVVRATEVVLGTAGPPSVVELVGLAGCVAGVALVVRHPVVRR